MDLCRADVALPVYLCWVTRTEEEYIAFEDLLLNAKNSFSNLSIRAWITLSGQSSCDNGTSAQDNSQAATYFPASAPNSSRARKPKGSQKGQSTVWRPFTTWLWPMYVHAGVTALAILLGVLGYSLSRNHEINESVGEPRATLTDRFLDCLVVILIVSGLLYVLIGLRVLIRAIRGSSVSDVPRPKSPLGMPSSAVDLEQQYSFIDGIGKRPNMENVFEEIASVHPENVAVLGCGPRPMVDAVKRECQKRVWKSWLVSDEEWEW